MEISEIKSRLPILSVLSYYGFNPNRNKMLHCPFHEDKTPSMQVYPETGTVYCFSSNCRLHGKAIDQIDFIMQRENFTKHQAIEKAKTMAGEYPTPDKQNHIKSTQPEKLSEADYAIRIAVLTKLLYESLSSMKKSTKAQGYCKSRGLDHEQLEMGYLSERFYQSWNENLKQSALKIGLLKENKNGSLGAKFRNCLLFFMKDADGKPVDVYGRSLTDNKDQRHFFLKGKQQGIYPHYPAADTKKLILTEGIIDAASLLQIPEIKENYAVMALYGTNGLTEEHVSAIQNLNQLRELILMLDGDGAGKSAIEKHSRDIHQLLPHISISKTDIPEGEDINSLLQSHDQEVIPHLLSERSFLFSSESSGEKKKETGNNKLSDQETSDPDKQSELDSRNKDKIVYQTANLKIEIWGGIDYGNLHRLKLSLYLEHPKTKAGFRDDVNLYSHRSRKAFLQDASEELDIPQTELKDILETFTRKVEHYRLKQKARNKTVRQPEPPKLSHIEQAEALKLLKDPKLINRLKAAMSKTGLVGESNNGLLLFLIFLTRFFEYPLHALVHGSSGSGKTNLLQSVLKLVPEESRFSTTALTENVLFRPPYKEFWRNRILVIEDLDGIYKALLALREFMSNQYISKLVSELDTKTGQYKQILLEARGPVVIAGATTRDKLYEDNANRSFLLHVNESKTHQHQILDYQNQLAAGLIHTESIEQICLQIHNIQRILNKQIQVINPFQPQLKLPEYVFKKLRTNTHYITLIKAITFLHQYRREHKKDAQGRTYIETTLEDVALANELSKQSLLRKSDELGGQLRDFFEVLKTIVRSSGQTAFVAKAMRNKFRMHPMTFNRRIRELQSRSYIRQTGGNQKTGYEYEIVVWDDYRVLKKGLLVMDEILDGLWKKYPDGRYIRSVQKCEKAEV